LVTASDLVFTGVMNGEFQALDADTGTAAERELHPGLPATGSSSSEAGVLFMRP
jgi:hypothetical protein